MRGPKPKPAHLKLIQGNRGKRPIKPEVEVAPSLPEPLPFLCHDAQEEWRRVASQLYALRLLSELDLAALAAYCAAYATWKQAHEALSEMAKHDPVSKALMIKSKKGNLIQNPLLGIANTAAGNMVRYASEFGLTPSSRARIAAGPGEVHKNPGDKYFS